MKHFSFNKCKELWTSTISIHKFNAAQIMLGSCLKSTRAFHSIYQPNKNFNSSKYNNVFKSWAFMHCNVGLRKINVQVEFNIITEFLSKSMFFFVRWINVNTVLVNIINYGTLNTWLLLECEVFFAHKVYSINEWIQKKGYKIPCISQPNELMNSWIN